MTTATDLYGPTRVPTAALAEGTIPVFIYAVKSSPDEKDAISTQLKWCYRAIADEGGRQLMAEPFTEDNASGFKAERGDQLDAAIEAATHAAEKYGHAELWVWHSSRFARGDGRRSRRSLTTVWAHLRYCGVTLRSADPEDDEDLRSETTTAQASTQHNRYSRNLQKWVRDGKERMREAGRYLGGAVPDGYSQATRRDGTKGPRVLDDARVPTIRRMFEIGKSMGDSPTARKLNREGYRRKSGALWTPVAVHQILVNPHYAGRYTQRDGSYVPAIVSDADFDAVQLLRPGGPRTERTDENGNPPPRKRVMPKGGRNTDRYVLAKIGKCGRCGGSIYGRTSAYTRKDGTNDQNYMCRRSAAYRSVDATCDQPLISVQAVDSAIVPHLRGFFVDFEKWLQQVTAAEGAQRDAAVAQLAEATDRLARLTAAYDRAQDRLVDALADPDADNATVDAREAAVKKIAAEKEQVGASVGELTATLAELNDAETPVDAMLDHWNAVSARIRGVIDSAGGEVADINAGLREVLDRVEIDTLPDGRIKMLAFFSERSGRGEWMPAVDQNYEPIPGVPAEWVPDQVDIFASPKLQPSETIPFAASVAGKGDLPKRNWTPMASDSVDSRGLWRLQAPPRTSATSTRSTTTSPPRPTTPSGASTSARSASSRC